MTTTPENAPPRTAIVTGATSGIGEASARALYEVGHKVLLTGRSLATGEALAADLGPRARFVAADLTSANSAQHVVRAAYAFGGGLDVLVNNAGIDHTGDLLTTPMDTVRAVFETNTFASLAMLQAAGALMKKRGGGSIINITSRLASIGVPSMSIYAASKGAVLALTRSAAVELAPYNIRVNAVAPGMTRTPLFEAWAAEQSDPAGAARSAAAGIPLGRLAEARDVASAVVYLASDAAAYLTGISLPVDGGYTAT
ncbi:SDR family NAD(P)-dependent oxidoreductase [Paenarthrobacter sp. NPDC058040]|uniref:SDR family NAD(P)-dependent oxidoreductase n=1 Tax=unclassified Paenarthrobacter TaxID=2634190 RepID=UPI0036DCF1CD